MSDKEPRVCECGGAPSFDVHDYGYGEWRCFWHCDECRWHRGESTGPTPTAALEAAIKVWNGEEG